MLKVQMSTYDLLNSICRVLWLLMKIEDSVVVKLYILALFCEFYYVTISLKALHYSISL